MAPLFSNLTVLGWQKSFNDLDNLYKNRDFFKNGNEGKYSWPDVNYIN